MGKLSVVISAYNEETKLPACLESVAFADEIILIDNDSTDKTAEIAKKYKAKVFSTPNNLMLNVNKNFGFTKAVGDWILNLDADERITAELAEEIKEVVRGDVGDVVGYAIPRKNIIFGKWIRHTGWYPDFQLRLFKKGRGKFSERHVHEQIGVEGKIEKLHNPMIHENYQTVSQFLQKLFLIYAPNEAENIFTSEVVRSQADTIISARYVFHWTDAVSHAIGEFTRRFYAQKGYKDGVHGFMLSVLMAFYYFVVYTYVWEKQKFSDSEYNMLSQVNEEISSTHGFKYWQATAALDQAVSPVAKIYHRIRRKLAVTFPHL